MNVARSNLPVAFAQLAIAAFLASNLVAAPPNFFFSFEEAEGTPLVTDVGGSGIELKLCGDSHVTTTQAKFGSGSLEIGANKDARAG